MMTMISLLVVAAVLSLLGSCNGQYPTQYDDNYGPKYSNYGSDYGGSYSNPSYSNGDAQAEAELDALVINLDTLTTRSDGLIERIDLIKKRSSLNLGLTRDFREIYDRTINNEYVQMNGRLDRLAEKISQIQGLRSQVDNLQRSAEEATKVIEGIVQSDNDIAVTIENLQNVRVEQDARICDIQKRADIVAERLEVLAETTTISADNIDRYELTLREAINVQNVAKLRNTRTNLNLEDGFASTTIDYDGVAEAVVNHFTGFSFRRSYGYPSGYGTQYPSGYGTQYSSGYGTQYPSGYGTQYPSGYGTQYPSGGQYPAGTSLQSVSTIADYRPGDAKYPGKTGDASAGRYPESSAYGYLDVFAVDLSTNVWSADRAPVSTSAISFTPTSTLLFTCY